MRRLRTYAGSRDSTGQARLRTSLIPFAQRINPWMVVAVLALSGWLIDSLLVALHVNGLAQDGLRVHLWHLWYLPLLLASGLLLVQHYRPELMSRVTAMPVFDGLIRNLRPELKTLARDVTCSETRATLLTVLQAYPTLSLTATDLAGTVGGELEDVELALEDLTTLGLIEKQTVYDLTFYRLTQDEIRRKQLREVAAWQDSWSEQANQLAQLVGRRLSVADRLERR